MKNIFNVYCDESCHLENDNIPVMVLGAIWCKGEVTKKIARDIRGIKLLHGFKSTFEVKWTKVSKSKEAFYLDLIDYFFSCDDMFFRGLVISNKKQLDHQAYNHDHDTFYYKMYFYLLNNIISNNGCFYRVYLDIKDTQGSEKIRKLKEVLSNANYDFDRTTIERIQHIHSHESEQLQLADLFIGALSYVHRQLHSNEGKLSIIKRIQQHSSKTLLKSTLPTERKLNVFVWEPRSVY